MLQRCISALILILAISVCCSAAAKAGVPPVIPPLPQIENPLASGWALGDLDGDHKTDIAQSHGIGRGDNGYLYRVELMLSETEQSGSFTFSNTDALGVNIAAVDVDGDHDLDLVISGRFFGQRIGVWINDGKGSFTQNVHRLYPTSDGPSLESFRVDVPRQAVDDKVSRRLPSLVPDAAFVRPPSLALRTDNRAAVRFAFRAPRGQHYLRAPPAAPSI